MHSFYLPSRNLDLITVSGADAVRFLQGQLTCDVAALPDPGFTRGALCNNKGRVLATFVLVKHDAVFYMALNSGLGEVVTLALKKYLPFYKCEFHLFTAGEHACAGISGVDTLAALDLAGAPPASGQCSAIADGWICTLDAAQRQFLVWTRAPLQVPGSIATGLLEDWLVSGLQSGQFPFVTDDVEKYTPQELHLDRHGYVSFTKGCYTGQEIVARMHYRGKLKKLLFLLSTAVPGAFPGTEMEVLDPNGVLLGTVVKVLRDGTTAYALAHLPSEIEHNVLTGVNNRAGFHFDLQVF